MSRRARPDAPERSGPTRTRQVPGGALWAWRDSWTEAVRHLRAIPRQPDLLVFSIVQPVMFVVLFAYVFGDSITVPGYPDYLQYLMPAVFAQSIVFNSNFTGVGVAEDLSTGLIDRLRSLPMFRPGVLVGRTISDLCRNVGTFFVMLAVGYFVGFRIEGGLAGAIGATALLLGFGYAFSWIQALIGLSVSSAESASSAGFIWMFPLTFISSGFVDPSSMPAAFEWFAGWNPFSTLCDAARALYNGTDPGSDVWASIAWAVGITVVFATLSCRRFTRTAVR
jgi:ABC-2 type transport system permease protein